MTTHNQTMKVQPMFGKFSSADTIISLHKLISFYLEFPYKYILMSDSDLELINTHNSNDESDF